MDGNLRFTLTLATSVKPDQPSTCFGIITEVANTAVHFCHSIMRMLDDGFLEPGDIIVMDNAPVSFLFPQITGEIFFSFFFSIERYLT